MLQLHLYFQSAQNMGTSMVNMSSVLNATKRSFSNIAIVNLAEEQPMSNDQILSANADKRTKPVVYSRVMGYTIPVERFNIGKQGEHRERQFFKETCCSK